LLWAEAARRVDIGQVSGHTVRSRAALLAAALADEGDLAGAETVLRETLDLCRKAGDRSWEATELEALARIELKTGRREEAGPDIGEAIRISTEISDRQRLVDCLGTAAVWAAHRDPETAAVLWGSGRALGQTIGTNLLAIADIIDHTDPKSASDSRFYAEPMLAVRAELGPERARLADQRGASMSLDAILELTRTVLRDSPAPASGTTLPASNLTKREHELVTLVAEGLTDGQIAEKLFISVRTVRSHLDRIRDKTGARRRADLTRLALGRRPR
jgi:DNA-binding CsgD family transcriptional regulator